MSQKKTRPATEPPHAQRRPIWTRLGPARLKVRSGIMAGKNEQAYKLGEP